MELRQLEGELGAQLLHRSAQGVLCTDAGKVFYEHAQAILKQVADARSAVTQSTTRPSGSVTLGLPHSISGALALPLLLAARASYPEITLQLTEELSGSLAEQLKSGRITILPAAPLLSDIERGALTARALHSPSLSRRVTLCASKNIPLTNAAAAVSRLVLQVTRDLCERGAWRGAHLHI